MVGLDRFELSTPRLSSVCSNQLSYRPGRVSLSKLKAKEVGLTDVSSDTRSLEDSRKEVIQPQVPLRLPCYDFTPVTIHSFGGSLLTVG